MPRPTVLFLCLLLLATPCVAQTAATTSGSEIPFSPQKGLIIVDAKIKGAVPVQVILATGMERSITDLALLQKYELDAYYAADGPVTGRNDQTYGYTIVSGVKVGNSKSKDLQKFVAIFDYRKGFIVLERC